MLLYATVFNSIEWIIRNLCYCIWFETRLFIVDLISDSTFVMNPFISISNSLSDINAFDFGEPQGSCLGPLICLLFITRFYCNKERQANMHANYITISHPSKTLEELQPVLNPKLIYMEMCPKWTSYSSTYQNTNDDSFVNAKRISKSNAQQGIF